MTNSNLSARSVRGRIAVTAALAALISLIALPAYASERATELGLDFGRTEVDESSVDASGNRVGLRGGYFFTPRIGVEGQLSRMESDEQGIDTRLNTVFINGLFKFRPKSRIEPYLLTGVGRAKLKFEGAGIGSLDDSSVAYQVGAGSRFFVDPERKLAIRVELSRMHERTFDEGTDYNNVTGGIAWRLGNRS